MMDVAMIESAAGLLLIAAMIVRVVPWRQREEQKGRSGTGISQTKRAERAPG